jgi:iron complex outermembrane receptor protein
LPNFISFAKLRGSYAIVGNDTSPYRLSTGFEADNFNDNPALNLFRYENNTAISPDLQPEKKYSWETGLDIRFFNNRVGLDVAYYKDNTKNQIIDLPVPSESGINRQLINAGNLQNSGIEAALDVNIVDTKDFSWDIGANFTRNRDKIIELAPGINEFNLYGNPDDSNAGTASFAYVGGNYGDLVTRRGYTYYDGANTENHDIPILANRNGWSVAYPIGINNLDSLHVMGNMQPDWYGGANTSIRFKRLRLSAIVDARYGGEIYSADARYGLHQGVLKSSLPYRDASQGGIVWTSQGQGQNFYGKTYEDGYIPHGVFPDGTTITSGPADNRTNVDVGGLTYQQAYEQGLVEPTHWSGYIYRWTSASTGTPITGVYTQSWVALRELSLSYQVPESILDKLSISSASLSLTGRDLGFIYNSMPDNINPSISNNAAANPLQMRSAPYVRSITFAVNLNF